MRFVQIRAFLMDKGEGGIRGSGSKLTTTRPGFENLALPLVWSKGKQNYRPY